MSLDGLTSPSDYDETWIREQVIRGVVLADELENTPECHESIEALIVIVNINVNIKYSWRVKELFDSLWQAIRSAATWIEPVSNYLIKKFRQVRLAIFGDDIVIEDKKDGAAITKTETETKLLEAQIRHLDSQTEAQNLENQKQQAIQSDLEKRIQTLEQVLIRRGMRCDAGHVDNIKAHIWTKVPTAISEEERAQ